MSRLRKWFWKCGVIVALGLLPSLINGQSLTAPLSIQDTISWHILVHNWYPAECCMGIDCQPVNDSEIIASDLGWYVIDSGETIPFNDPRVRASPDFKFHRCLEEFWEPRSATRCLFVPRGAGV